jgi:tRNA-Thr(GGU) m(6)t(6)A37 methyltransferase TsaA
MKAPPGDASTSLTLTPIGVAHTPFTDKVSAPRQPYAAKDATGTIELFAGRGFEHALEDLEGWERIWVVFWFHLNEGWRPKVLPPRSTERRGVFSTRSPHRPNPLGMSVVRLDAVEGLVLRVSELDLVDGTPVLDIKPYVPIADAHPASRTGWLGRMGDAPTAGAPVEPEPGFEVTWSARALAEAAYLRDEHGLELAEPVTRTLALGPQPHPYRRIKRDGDALVLALKDWRVRFRVEGRVVTVDALASGYRPKQLEDGAGVDATALLVHCGFVARFGR